MKKSIYFLVVVLVLCAFVLGCAPTPSPVPGPPPARPPTPPTPAPPTPNTGTINVDATLYGSPWSGSVSYIIAGPTTVSGSSVSSTFPSLPPGTYTIAYNSGGPGGPSGLISVTPSATQTLPPGGTITFTLNFSTPNTGTIIVNATLYGSPWSGSVSYIIAGPTTVSGSSVSSTFPSLPPGTYTIAYNSGGPGGPSGLISVTPSATQTLPPGGTITFTLNFSTPTTGIINVNVTLNGSSWSGPVNYTITGPTQTISGTSTLSYSNLSSGSYTIYYNYGGPSGATLASITPSATQTLTSGGVIAFILNFTTVTTGIPELMIASLTHSPANPTTTDQITFTAVVRNAGTGSAGASTLSFKVGGETTPPTYSVPALAPGATYTVQRQLVLGVAQNYLITVIVDVNNNVAESNEANNQGTDTVSVGAAGVPDLIVASLTHSPANPTTTDQITFTAVVRNAGTGSAGASTLSFKVGGETTPPTYSVPALAPGATYTVQRQLVLGVAQNYLITVIVDVNNNVAESNEANNQGTDTVSVH